MLGKGRLESINVKQDFLIAATYNKNELMLSSTYLGTQCLVEFV